MNTNQQIAEWQHWNIEWIANPLKEHLKESSYNKVIF
jgi:hypothetical protein